MIWIAVSVFWWLLMWLLWSIHQSLYGQMEKMMRTFTEEVDDLKQQNVLLAGAVKEIATAIEDGVKLITDQAAAIAAQSGANPDPGNVIEDQVAVVAEAVSGLRSLAAHLESQVNPPAPVAETPAPPAPAPADPAPAETPAPTPDPNQPTA